LVAEVVSDLETTGEPVPEPLSTRPFSGRFLVRIPPELHRRLAIEAAEAGISLNRLASDKLSRVDA
jgi:predicted HicB family RNase H-like nuclease